MIRLGFVKEALRRSLRFIAVLLDDLRSDLAPPLPCPAPGRAPRCGSTSTAVVLARAIDAGSGRDLVVTTPVASYTLLCGVCSSSQRRNIHLPGRTGFRRQFQLWHWFATFAQSFPSMCTSLVLCVCLSASSGAPPTVHKPLTIVTLRRVRRVPTPPGPRCADHVPFRRRGRRQHVCLSCARRVEATLTLGSSFGGYRTPSRT